MPFIHHDHVIPQYETVMIEGRRYYKTNLLGYLYPSITTVLSSIKSPGLEIWRKQVGSEYADKFAKQRAAIGTQLHLACETYLKNSNILVMPNIQVSFNQIKPYLNLINHIHAQEQAMISNELEIGGRCDLIGEYDKKLSVIDFKTSNSDMNFTEDKLHKYYLQCEGYATMFDEAAHMKPTQAVIIVASEYGPQVYIEPNLPLYHKELTDICRNYPYHIKNMLDITA